MLIFTYCYYKYWETLWCLQGEFFGFCERVARNYNTDLLQQKSELNELVQSLLSLDHCLESFRNHVNMIYAKRAVLLPRHGCTDIFIKDKIFDISCIGWNICSWNETILMVKRYRGIHLSKQTCIWLNASSTSPTSVRLELIMNHWHVKLKTSTNSWIS